MKFLLFRFFINEINQQPLFSNGNDRLTAIYDAFSKTHIFSPQSNYTLAYVPNIILGKYIGATIGKKSHLSRILPPDQEFQREDQEHWPGIQIYIEVDEKNGDGQRIAVEINNEVFKNPINTLREFADAINKDNLFSAGLVLTINPIIEEHNFWEIVKTQKVSELTFTFAPPNLFGLNRAIDKDLKEGKEKLNFTQVSVDIKNPQGKLTINEETPFVKQGLDYITSGGGNYKLKFDGKTISSEKNNIKTKTIEGQIEIETENKDAFQAFIDKLFK